MYFAFTIDIVPTGFRLINVKTFTSNRNFIKVIHDLQIPLCFIALVRVNLASQMKLETALTSTKTFTATNNSQSSLHEAKLWNRESTVLSAVFDNNLVILSYFFVILNNIIAYILLISFAQFFSHYSELGKHWTNNI